jgi:SAM-dependent methyltransferase
MSSDHFSHQAADYAKYRPTYPAALFDWLREQVPATGMAWDCACGNGQATLALAERFAHVIATDLSTAQLAQAPARPNIEWRVATAEANGLADQSVELVTVAQALHWFDLPRFWSEVRRVLQPGGVIAVWSYGVATYPTAALTEVCDDFYRQTLGNYWPPERALVEAGYAQLTFPFAEITPPALALEASWSLPELLGYFSSWSATTRYRQATGHDPLSALREQLAPLYPSTPAPIRWPLSLRVGRV